MADRQIVQMSQPPGAGNPRKDYTNVNNYRGYIFIYYIGERKRCSRYPAKDRPTSRVIPCAHTFIRGPCEPDIHARFDRTMYFTVPTRTTTECRYLKNCMRIMCKLFPIYTYIYI